MFLQPLSGLILAVLILGDRPTPGFLIGCALVLAGVYLAAGGGRWRRVSSVVLAMLVLTGCTNQWPSADARSGAPVASAVTLRLQSSAFSVGGTIPVDYTCDGPDLSPPLCPQRASHR